MTCGTMAREDLFGQSLEIKEHPARAVATEQQGSILVAYGDSVVWSFEIEECQTWFVSQNQPNNTSFSVIYSAVGDGLHDIENSILS